MERFLITGGQGFFGAWIARRLLDERVPFVLTDRERNDHILRQVLSDEEIERLDRRYGDIADREFVRALVGESNATRVLHLAGLQVPTCRSDPLLGARVNVLGTLAVFEAVRASAGRVECVVYASSAAVVGPPTDYTGKIPDLALHRPRTHYGVFKQANEGSARIYWYDHGVPSVGLRPYSVYGVGREIGITSGPTKAIRAAVKGEPFTVPFRGPTCFNFIEDVARAFVECARRHREGALAFNQPGSRHDVREFLDLVERIVPDSKGRLACEGDEIPIASDLDGSGLDRLLDGVATTPLEVGIRRTAERYRELFAAGRLE